LSSARAELSSQTEALGRALKEGEAARREAADRSAQLEKLQASLRDKQGASDNVRSCRGGWGRAGLGFVWVCGEGGRGRGRCEGQGLRMMGSG
jgi:hypothetical protein